MKRSGIAFVLLVLLTPALALAEEPAPSLRRSIEHVDFQRLGLPPRQPVPPRYPSAARNSLATKITAGVAGAVVGSLGGALIGAGLDRNCRCDDPGLMGMMIGVPIGATVGAVVGVMLASR